MTNNRALSSLRKNVILINIILTTDGTIGCVKSDKWYQRVWDSYFGAGPYLTVLVIRSQAVQHPVPQVAKCVWSKCGGQLEGVGRGFLRWRVGVFRRTSCHIWANWNLQCSY